MNLLEFHDEHLSLSLFMPAGYGHFLPCDGYICRVWLLQFGTKSWIETGDNWIAGMGHRRLIWIQLWLCNQPSTWFWAAGVYCYSWMGKRCVCVSSKFSITVYVHHTVLKLLYSDLTVDLHPAGHFDLGISGTYLLLMDVENISTENAFWVNIGQYTFNPWQMWCEIANKYLMGWLVSINANGSIYALWWSLWATSSLVPRLSANTQFDAESLGGLRKWVTSG